MKNVLIKERNINIIYIKVIYIKFKFKYKYQRVPGHKQKTNDYKKNTQINLSWYGYLCHG